MKEDTVLTRPALEGDEASGPSGLSNPSKLVGAAAAVAAWRKDTEGAEPASSSAKASGAVKWSGAANDFTGRQKHLLN